MRILYLCHRIPYPPDKGDKIRAFHELRGMSAAHEVDVFTLADDPADLAYRSALAGYCRSLKVAQINPKLARLKSLPYLLTRTALTLPFFHSAELAGEVRKALAERSYDRVFLYSSAMAQYLDGENSASGNPGPVITDLVDVDSDKWTQYAGYAGFPWAAIYRREGRRLREYERKVCQKSASVVVTTEREAQLAREIWGAARVHVIPNGVDSVYFSPAPGPKGSDAGDSWPPTVTFMGDMSYFPNQQAVLFFAKRVLPLIRRTSTSARFLIVGRNPPREVRELQKIEGVEVTGWVSDVRPYLAQTRVSVAPFLIASGVQNKILEAMAYGLPVVATPRAIQGLSNGVGRLVETGEDAAQLAEAVVLLLRDPEFARRRGMEGRQRVTVDYSWQTALDYLLQLIENPSTADVETRISERQMEAELLGGKVSNNDVQG